MPRRNVPKESPITIDTLRPNKGSTETRYIVYRGFSPFLQVVGYVSKIKNTRTDTHPWKAWHVGWDQNIIKESFRVFYDDERYAKDGAYPGGKKAAFDYAARGKSFTTHQRPRTIPMLRDALSRPIRKEAGASIRVRATAWDIRDFMQRWPASHLNPNEDIVFTFADNGDLVDIEPQQDPDAGPALAALSRDVWEKHHTRGA